MRRLVRLAVLTVLGNHFVGFEFMHGISLVNGEIGRRLFPVIIFFGPVCKNMGIKNFHCNHLWRSIFVGI